MSEGRTINAGNYIEGNVNGGNVAGRDININNGQGMSKEEFMQLLQTFKKDVAESELPEDIVDSVTSDVENVEKQLQKDKPSKAIVTNKINGVNDLLEQTDEIIEAVEKGSERFEKILSAAAALAAGVSIFF